MEDQYGQACAGRSETVFGDATVYRQIAERLFAGRKTEKSTVRDRESRLLT